MEPTLFACPYLGGDVQLTDEREKHIIDNHPELLPDLHALIAATLADQDEVRRSARFGSARLFSRWFASLRNGKNVIVVVISDVTPVNRHWIVTAYLSSRLAGGEIEWKRP